MDADALIHEIGSRVAREALAKHPDLASVALVSRITVSSDECYGYVYDDDGKAEGYTPDDDEIVEKLRDLWEAMQVDGKAPWLACLLKITRETGKITFDFEHHDDDRWRVRPDNFRQMQADLRPS